MSCFKTALTRRHRVQHLGDWALEANPEWLCDLRASAWSQAWAPWSLGSCRVAWQ